MTIGQLRVFATVARLGSVNAAAAELGVGKSAISEAVAALRRELGDRLYGRSMGALVLTRGGRELVARAEQILGLLDGMPRAIASAKGEALPLLRIAATAPVAEFAIPSLSAAFVRARGLCEFQVMIESPRMFARLLREHRVDVALGPALEHVDGMRGQPSLEVTRFLRVRYVIVTAPTHRLARRDVVPVRELGNETWLTGSSTVERWHPVAQVCRRWALTPSLRVFETERAALHGAADGEGVALAPAHVVADDVRQRRLVVTAVDDVAILGYWHASALAIGLRRELVDSLMRFVLSPAATQALLVTSGSVPAVRSRPPVHVNLWS